MPIDPNIALGVRPIEQPNMLGQMAQAMQIRQANQEYDDVNAMRSISAKYGGDISNPDFLKEVGMRSPKTAADLRAKALANDKTTGEIVKSRLETSRELLSNVRTPEEYLAWHEGNHKDPLLGPLLASKGITADTSMATIQESLKRPGGFEELLKKSAMGLEKFYADQTSRANAATATGPAYARLAMEQKERAEADFLFGRPTTTAPAVVPMGGGSGGGGGGAPMSAPAGVRVPNALPATVGATPAAPVANMLVPGAQAPVTTPATTPAPSPAFAPTGDAFDKIKAIEAEITRLRPYMSNPRVAANVQQLNTDRTQLLALAEREYGGNIVDMSIENPEKPGTYITVKGKLDQYGVAQPLKTGAMPRVVDITSGTSINLPVARPAPRVGYQYNNKGEEVKIPQTGVPEGVRLKPDERWNETKQVVEQVPGSAAFIEQQAKHGKDLGALKTTQATTKWGTERIDKILDPKNKTGFENNFGGFTAYATKELSGNTALVKAELDSLKSDLKNKGLQMFRAGGSIGAMTEKEWPIVESMLATITPKMDIKDAREVLEAVRAKFEALENLAVEKYNDQWQGTQYHKPVSTSGSGAGASTGATSSQPIYATNGKDRIMSTDGGNTWTPVGAK